MIRIAHIKDGKITNVSLAKDGYVLPQDGSQMLESDALAAGLTFATARGPAPESITPRQLRLWLLSQGITAQLVTTHIQGLPPSMRDSAMIEWEYALDFKRDHPLVQQFGFMLGFSAPELEEGWRVASEL